MPIHLDWDQDVATLTVARPDRHNALTRAALASLGDALDDAAAEGARVLVVTGAGDEAFVAGADVSELVDLTPAEADEYAARGHAVVDAVADFPAPVVAAIDGYCLGGGLELALACDLRVAAEDAVFGLPEVDLGIVPGWGGTQRLPAIVGEERARRMIYFGERLDATDAHEIGLVGDVVARTELDDYVAGLAADLTEKSPDALRAAKEALGAREALGRQAGAAVEQRAWASLFGTEAQRTRMADFLDR